MLSLSPRTNVGGARVSARCLVKDSSSSTGGGGDDGDDDDDDDSGCDGTRASVCRAPHGQTAYSFIINTTRGGGGGGRWGSAQHTLSADPHASPGPFVARRSALRRSRSSRPPSRPPARHRTPSEFRRALSRSLSRAAQARTEAAECVRRARGASTPS